MFSLSFFQGGPPYCQRVTGFESIAYAGNNILDAGSASNIPLPQP